MKYRPYGYSFSNFGSAPPHSGEELGRTLLPTENAREEFWRVLLPKTDFKFNNYILKTLSLSKFI